MKPSVPERLPAAILTKKRALLGFEPGIYNTVNSKHLRTAASLWCCPPCNSLRQQVNGLNQPTDVLKCRNDAAA